MLYHVSQEPVGAAASRDKYNIPGNLGDFEISAHLKLGVRGSSLSARLSVTWDTKTFSSSRSPEVSIRRSFQVLMLNYSST